MPNIYLSPSTQEWNHFVNGGTEEYWMNLIADAMEPYLRSSGIRFTRNTPQMTAASSIRQSNQGNYDLHLALHSNAAPEGEAGMRQGSEVYYYPTGVRGQRAADIIAENLKAIYPYPWLVKTVPTTYLGEVAKTRAPGVLIEFAYHDNPEDATWIKEHIGEIAENVVLSLTEYFDIPFIPAQPSRQGTVTLNWGYLNIRQKPSTDSPVIGRAWDGNPITVLGQWENWYVVDYYGTIGYVDDRYVKLSPKQ
ncbi:N-acetylmuramoyl-L-alanine amidase [Anaerotruncus rubiinfantis]|uniref:N-acetylmuramoyl-L-alanine amidase n=1 Tax=Anaerotruncus rubiinfantis TaxID=1720200 RepID=UPI0011CB4CDB|nr:N-acetylmuramoyl-L-alanine amidase [Anaerotruncus rubiinfantis]